MDCRLLADSDNIQSELENLIRAKAPGVGRYPAEMRLPVAKQLLRSALAECLNNSPHAAIGYLAAAGALLEHAEG